MTIVQIVLAGVVCTILALAVKRNRPDFAIVVSVGASVLLVSMVLPQLRAGIGVIYNLGGFLDTRIPYVTLVLQILGIAYVAEIGSQICHDAGEGAIASKIEMAGKILIMIAAAPVLLDVLQMIVGIMP